MHGATLNKKIKNYLPLTLIGKKLAGRPVDNDASHSKFLSTSV
jgi:hypothetical protein